MKIFNALALSILLALLAACGDESSSSAPDPIGEISSSSNEELGSSSSAAEKNSSSSVSGKNSSSSVVESSSSARNSSSSSAILFKALLAIMVVDIQREYRFYSESGNTPSKKHGHTPEIRRNRLQGTLNAKSPGGIGLVWMTSGFGAGYGF